LKKQLKKLGAFLIIFALITSNLNSLTLKEAIKIALKNNFEINSKAHELKSSEYLIGSAKSLKMPSFFITSSYTYLDSPKKMDISYPPYFSEKIKVSEKDYIDLVTGINLNVYTGGFINSKIHSAKYLYKIKKAQLSEKKLDVIYATQIAYLTVLELKSFKKIAQKHIEALLSHLKDVKDYYHQGLVPYVDILQTEVKLKKAEQNLTKIENDIITAKANLSIIMGLSPDENFTLKDVKVPLKEKLYLKNLYKIALEKRPYLKMIKYNLSRIEWEIEGKKSEIKPKFSITSGYKYSDIQDNIENKGNFFIQGALKFNIDWDKTFKEINALKEEKISIKFQLLSAKSKILFGVKKALNDFKTSLKNLEVAKSEVKSAKEYFRIVKLKYKNGLSDNTDVLNAEAMVISAMMREKTDYFNALKKFFLIKRVTGEGGFKNE